MAEGSGARKRRKKPNPGNPRKKKKNNPGTAADNASEDRFSRLFKLIENLPSSSSGAETAISDILTVMLGSVPSIAVGETMLTASQAQGQMLANAVANQQKTNIVSMVATVGCVAQLLDMSPGKLWRDVEMDEEEELEDEFEESED